MTDIVNRLQGVILNAERENSVIHAALEEIQRLRRENQALDAQCAPGNSLGTLWQHSETGRTMVIMRGDPQPRGIAGAPWLFVGTVHVDRDGLDVPEPVAPTQIRFDFMAHIQRAIEFSERTFGPGMRTAGVVDHIRKELREIEAAPADLEEWVDVLILALDGAWRTGATPEQIVAQIETKQAKNERRSWPDWRTVPTDRAIEHDRTGEQAAPVPEHTGRWNIDLNDDGSLSVCRGHHGKDEPCAFERFVPVHQDDFSPAKPVYYVHHDGMHAMAPAIFDAWAPRYPDEATKFRPVFDRTPSTAEADAIGSSAEGSRS